MPIAPFASFGDSSRSSLARNAGKILVGLGGDHEGVLAAGDEGGEIVPKSRIAIEDRQAIDRDVARQCGIPRDRRRDAGIVAPIARQVDPPEPPGEGIVVDELDAELDGMAKRSAGAESSDKVGAASWRSQIRLIRRSGRGNHAITKSTLSWEGEGGEIPTTRLEAGRVYRIRARVQVECRCSHGQPRSNLSR